MINTNKLEKKVLTFLKGFSASHYLVLILAASFLARVIYIFYFTNYKDYLTTDMGGYWNRAQDRYNGNIFSVSQWTAWPTFFHFYLAFVFKILNFLDLLNYKLEAVLLLNIILSVISIYFFYLISIGFFKNSTLSLLVTSLYAFCYPLIYFNALIMSENLSIPLFIISVYLVFQHGNDKFPLFLAGVLLGIAVCTRPAIALLMVPFILYIVFEKKAALDSLFKACIFTFGFFIIIFLVVLENSHISSGELKSPAGAGGVNFFISQCKVHIVKSNYRNTITHISPVLSYLHPGWEEYLTNKPIHDQKYFYELGFNCLKTQGLNFIIERLLSFRQVFFGSFFPAFPDAKYFDIFRILSDYLIFFMFVMLGILFVMRKSLAESWNKINFLLSIIFCIFCVMYFFCIEQRLFFPGYFAIYLLFFTVIFNVKKYKREIACYLLILLFFLFLYAFVSWVMRN